MSLELKRTAELLGEETMEAIHRATVAVVGLGGVGGTAAEALCRAGVSRLILLDHDVIEPSNLNRQLLATSKTIGQSKCDAARDRLLDINPDLHLTLLPIRYSETTADQLFSQQPDMVLDAIDTVTAKLHLAVTCKERGIPSICCLGTGNRTDPSRFRYGTIRDTAGSGCPLARVLRRELKKRGITDQAVIYSTEPPVKVVAESACGRHAPASHPCCPPAAGYLLAASALARLGQSGGEL